MNNEDKILALLGQIQQEQIAMRAMMKEELEPIRTDIADLKQGQANLEAGQADLKQDVRRLNQNVAVIESKTLHELAIIREGITGWNERNRQIDQLELKQEEHGHRIWALEQVVKN